MATHSSILAWKIPWTKEGYSSWGHRESDMVGYSSWGRRESDMTQRLSIVTDTVR